ncbi:MAG: PadR family transcriptional regulator [Streptosporangiales bacterium]|nr:PadR family transcriptional regulator [Streptosporangiales bacterium]
MSTAHVLLGLLARDGRQHGYGLKRGHDGHLPRSRPLAFGQVYATLGRLTRDGLVAEAGQSRDGGPERTSYELTDRGRAELAAWLGRVEAPAPYVSDTLFVKVIVALLAQPDEAAARDYLTAQRDAHTGRMRELTAVKTEPGSGLADVVAADYALAHLDADLRWMRTTLDRLAELRTTVRGHDDVRVLEPTTAGVDDD